jgi:hypothetical protein|tara:strand:+ start:399 stop:752 length:354 start_codon:yes stop_codon:yes gene_type:complete
MKIDRYNIISNLGSEFKKLKTYSHIPMPKKNDYLVGYIVRYFVQKSNDTNGSIFEINVNSVSKYVNNPFYKTTSIDWRITGTSVDIKKSNLASIKISSVDIPKIGLYLPNLLQFHQK